MLLTFAVLFLVLTAVNESLGTAQGTDTSLACLKYSEKNAQMTQN